MPVARVVLEPTIDNPDAPPMMLDVPVDEGGNPVGKRLLFGLQGDPNAKGEHYYPFAMTRSGQIASVAALMKSQMSDTRSSTCSKALSKKEGLYVFIQ